MSRRAEALQAFDRLLTIMEELREKCPWDRVQTFESLRHLTIEETYELADALVEGDMMEVKKELGDLFLHLVFYSKLGEEMGTFDVVDVLHGISDKLVHRHPHVYGTVDAVTEEQVKANWEVIKLKEGKKSVLEGVPKSLPALIKASRMQDKVRGVGFDWPNKTAVYAKIQEEMAELKEAEATGELQRVEDEFGDVLFSWVNYGRHLGIDPEMALARTNAKFMRRFVAMEEMAKELGLNTAELTANQWEELWVNVKLTQG